MVVQAAPEPGDVYWENLAALPAGLCLYFNHPLWELYELGALLQLPWRSLKELDLSRSKLSDVGADLSRFEHLTDLRLSDNQLQSIELHHMLRLRTLHLAFNQRVIGFFV